MSIFKELKAYMREFTRHWLQYLMLFLSLQRGLKSRTVRSTLLIHIHLGKEAQMKTAAVFCVNSSLKAKAWKIRQLHMFNRQLMPLTTNIAESTNITQQKNSSSNISLHNLTVALKLTIQAFIFYSNTQKSFTKIKKVVY